MCGIGGIAKSSGSIDDLQMHKLIKSLEHRGPDGSGQWTEKGVGLVHTRLSILDTSDLASQPMVSSTGRYIAAYNGEIFNFLELKKELVGLGFSFKSESDTEVLLSAFDKWGLDALNRLNGMWAMAIYDRLKEELLLCRDRYGIKPLYYLIQGSDVVFASEVKAIASVVDNKLTLNEKTLKQLAKGEFTSHGTAESYYKEIYSVPSGCFLKFKSGNFETHRWYTQRTVDVPGNYSDGVKALRDLISSATALRMRSDVPIATCLSGGVDSSTIAAFVTHLSSHKKERMQSSYTAFTVSFPNTQIDEFESTQRVAKSLGIKLVNVKVESPTPDQLELAMDSCDGPMQSLAFYPIWCLYREVKRQGIKVTLDGQGPDEMLAGYRPVEEAFVSALQTGNLSWFKDIWRTYSEQGEFAQFSSKDFVKGEAIKALKQLPKSLLGVGTYAELKNANLNLPVPMPLEKKLKNPLEASLFKQFYSAPLPGILHQFDRMSMAHGVEARMPFLDHQVVEFLYSIPSTWKVRDGFTKKILRDAMPEVVPGFVRNNKVKIGFNAPLVEWFKGPLRDWIGDQIHSADFLSDYAEIKNHVLNNFENLQTSSKWEIAWAIWPAVHLNWWLKKQSLGR